MDIRKQRLAAWLLSQFHAKTEEIRLLSHRRIGRRRRRADVSRAVSALEQRLVLSTTSTLYIDFDAKTGGEIPPGSLPNSFNALYGTSSWAASNSDALAFLDLGTNVGGQFKIVGDVSGDGRWDGDGTLNANDGLLAQRKILQTVRYFFKNYSVSVKATTSGWDVLQASQNDANNNTFVLFVGNDFLQGGAVNTLGRAYQSPQGENNEWFGFAYAGNIARKMASQELLSNKSPQDFIWNVSTTIAHEFGHMLGVGHPGKLFNSTDFVVARQGASAAVMDPLTSLMSSGGKSRGSRFVNADYAAFPNQVSTHDIDVEVYERQGDDSTTKVYAEGQNQHLELVSSFGSDATRYRARGPSAGFTADTTEEFGGFQLLQSFPSPNRDRDPDCSEAPPTPPGVRVRTGRFISLQ